MPVQSSVTKDVYSGNGVTTEWPITFQVNSGDGENQPVIDETEVYVYTVDALGISTRIFTNYEVSLHNLTVTYPTEESGLDPLANGLQIVLQRYLDLTQLIDYKNQGPFPAQTVQMGLDRLTMIAQQLQEQLARASLVDVSETESTESLAELLAQVLAALAAAQAAAAAAAASAAAAAASAAINTPALICVDLNNSGDVLSTGFMVSVPINFNGTINSVTTLGNATQTGSIVIDIKKIAYSSYVGSPSSICASAKPTISSGVKAKDSTLTGWTTSLSIGDVLLFYVDSVATFTQCSVTLAITRI